MFEEALKNWEEPKKHGRRYPYIALARMEKVDVHEAKTRKDDPDVWKTEERAIISILDVSENHADGAKLQYYIKKGMLPVKWFLPQGTPDEGTNRTSYADLLDICLREQQFQGLMAENSKLKAERSVMDQRVEEVKERQSGRKQS
jgi:hypothetical protein